MSNVFRSLLVPAADATMAAELAAMLDPVNSTGLFTTPLSPTGTEPATHYISTGYIAESFDGPLPYQAWTQDEQGQWVQTEDDPGSPAAVYAACQQLDPPAPYTLDNIERLWAAADVTDQDPWTAMSRLGLQLVQPEMPEPEAMPAPAAAKGTKKPRRLST
jgi:hypothetical protein